MLSFPRKRAIVSALAHRLFVIQFHGDLDDPSLPLALLAKRIVC